MNEQEPDRPEPEADSVPPLELSAEYIFQGRKEVVIVFENERYRLRITRRKRLILQK